jgi:hypothetical protein
LLARTAKDPDMSVATDSNTAAIGTGLQPDHVERALAAAIRDASRIADLLDALRTARLWIPLPDDGSPVTNGTAVTLPTVTYLGCDFVPAYTSADLLSLLVAQEHPVVGETVVGETAAGDAAVPHVVVRAADLARLMPPGIGIALNAGARQSVPIYPQGVAFLAADEPADERRVSVGPLPAQPEELLAGIRAGLARVPQAREATAGWLSVQFAGEGLVISVTLDDPSDATVRDAVIAELEHAALTARQDAGYAIDVTFPGEGEPDHIDHWVATAAQPFYVRG